MLDSREFKKKKCILKKSLLQIYSATIILTINLTQSEKIRKQKYFNRREKL